MARLLTIGQLAQATGVSAKTIRYYEQVGVLPVPSRSGAGYRQYARGDVHRLLFVRRARALGLSLATLKTLVAELDGGACLTMRPRLHTLVTEQLRTVQKQIAEFQLLEQFASIPLWHQGNASRICSTGWTRRPTCGKSAMYHLAHFAVAGCASERSSYDA